MGNPWIVAAYQGARKKRSYFEGWYFKHSAGPGLGVWSFIPGISRGESEGEGCAFVQAIEGATGRSWWFEYPSNAFRASTSTLDIEVGPNRFSRDGIHIDLSDESARIRASFSYGAFSEIKTPFWSPGVMGPFSFAPRMECNHGLVSLDHSVDGWVEVGGAKVEIADGRGYIEKDWGSSMPREWIWAQSNDFGARGDSVMLSIATIPWMGSSFTGFLCVASLGGVKRLFATYNGWRITRLEPEEHRVLCRMGRVGRNVEKESMEIEVSRERGADLRAPVGGVLSRRIAEAVDARMRVRWEKNGAGYETESPIAGLEIVGNAAALSVAEVGAAPGAEPGGRRM